MQTKSQDLQVTKLEVRIKGPRRLECDTKESRSSTEGRAPWGYSLTLEKFGFMLLLKKLLTGLQGHCWGFFPELLLDLNLASLWKFPGPGDLN